jgi:hypothetical protein
LDRVPGPVVGAGLPGLMLAGGVYRASRRGGGGMVSVAPFSAASISSMLDPRRPSETRSAVKALSVYADRKKAPTELGL